MRRASAATLPSLSGASSSFTSSYPSFIVVGCQSIARPAEWRLASCLPHISQRYSPQLTPFALCSSQASIAFVPTGILPPLHLVAESYWIGSIPLLRSLFAGLALRLGRAIAAAGIASASAAPRQTMYPIRIFITSAIGMGRRACTPESGGWTLRPVWALDRHRSGLL